MIAQAGFLHTAQQAQAFLELYEAQWSSVVAGCARILGSTPAAEDVTQEALLIVARRLPELPADSNLGGYLWTVAKRLAIRRVGRERAFPDDGRAFAQLADPAPGPAERLAGAELRAEIRAAAKRIPGRQREALVAFELEERSYAEIGASLGMNPNAVAQLIHRARRSMRTALEQVAA